MFTIIRSPLTENSTTVNTGESFTEFSNDTTSGDDDDYDRPWENSDPFISAHTRDLLYSLFVCYIGQVVMFLGIPGNVISCVVFFKQGLSDRVNLLLFWLAVADFINLTGMQVSSCSCYFSDSVQIMNFKILAIANIVYVYHWASYVSGTLIVVMSVDRCLSVVMPLKARRLLTYRSMLAAVLLSYIIPLVIYMPSFFAYNVNWRLDPSTNRSIAYMDTPSWFTMGGRLALLFVNYLALIAFPVYLIVVVFCCTITIVRLRQASRQRLQMTGKANDDGESGDNKITKMLLFLCVVYAVMLLPYLSGNFLYNVVPDFFPYKKYNNSFVVMFYVVIFMASCVNSTANIFTYLVLSSRFRETLKELCFWSKRKTKQPA